jgi:hypothetical protein
MLDAATRTLGDVRHTDRVEEQAALAALTASRIVSFMVEGGHFTLETLPLPSISRQFETQLAILWRRHQASNGDQHARDQQALVGAIDRIVAELYQLTTNDLVGFELALVAGIDAADQAAPDQAALAPK